MISYPPFHVRGLARPAALMLTVCLMALSACQPAGPADPAPAATAARSSRPRELAPAPPADDLAGLVGGTSAFALDLYQAIRGEDGNLFFSPYSISLALAMTYAGARGDTEAQMADALHFILPQAALHPAFNALDLALVGPPDGDPAGGAFRLNIANGVWAQEGYPVRPEFLDTLSVNYGAGLGLVDFVDEARREQARVEINRWVSDRTEGKIEELFAPDIFNEMTRLVLANAIYFKAEWEHPFLGGTQDDVFHLLDGGQATVPMMSRRAPTGFAQGPGFQAVDLAYKGERIRMLVLLPAPGQFQAFESALTSERLEQIALAVQPGDLMLYMPKFQYDHTLHLNQALAALGMPDAFDENRADFSGIAAIPPPLFISDVVHKAFVAVDELGTEAAAATGVVVGVTSMPEVVRVDRPFIFAIYDSQTGAVLFVGRVLNPAG